ncbi:hypothetical protein [Burkholderia ambifaria]|uniref:hypothetical protein n=1 Tax=Burkholderia ambifaria TaxID=152480 RepID=UPI0015882C72|nr:hypothetical protein [Burkholderia ambifaria]WDR86096.1 hypothetical protein OR986_06680 [Burkholderia ambifaria]WDR98728.1 hypothetical protein OR985_11640 [Burkholderia ambifaria]
MKIRLIEDGNLVQWVRTCVLIAGLLIMFIAYKYVPPAPFGGFLLLLGLGIAAVGGYASRAHLLHIKPFDKSYKKARESYKQKDEEDESK